MLAYVCLCLNVLVVSSTKHSERSERSLGVFELAHIRMRAAAATQHTIYIMCTSVIRTVRYCA